MQNIEMTVKGDELVIKIDLTKDYGRSKSGKSTIIATTAGNISIPDHPDIHLGLNLYRK
jgi:hypothetical protein